MKVESDSSNYARKFNLKSATVSKCAKEAHLATLKLDIDDLNIDKLKTVPIDSYKLSNVVEKEVVKKTAYHELVKKVDFNTKIDEIEKKIPNHDK